MESLLSMFVGRPWAIAAIAAMLTVAYASGRWGARQPARRTGGLLVAACCWGAFAAWEALVQWRTPEADIRVDLLVIWPIVAAVTVLAAWRALRRQPRSE